jgi:hypothetical protein
MGDVYGTFSIRREYAYAIGARHLELLLDHILPRKYPTLVGRVSYLHATVFPELEECFVFHITASIECRFPFKDLKNLFSCMLQSPILFSFLQCISRMSEGLYLLFFWATQQEISAERRNKRLISNFFFLRERDFLLFI